MSDQVLVDASLLREFITALYASHGLPEGDAALVADTLVQADLWGHQSHGVLRTSWYLERLRQGSMSPTTTLTTVRDRGSVAVLDGGEGVGQVIARDAMKKAIGMAKAHGVGAVAVRNSNHFGTVMYYTRMAALEGCLAFMTSNGGPAMAPWGGARNKIIGTNPWSLASPAGSHTPMILDMANTGVARGKIYLARQRGEKIPLGWAMDAAGAMTTDPDEAIKGLILPMAQHKGYAIAALVDVFSGVLSGSKFLSAVNGPYHYDKRSGAGHFITVYDVEAFMPAAEFAARMDEFVAEIKAQPLAQGVDEIFYPGEMEARATARQSRDGLPLPQATWDDLARLAAETGLEGLFGTVALVAA
jgi:LDH2 family malate/lactate/ureidoglycolate dehydrogenase